MIVNDVDLRKKYKNVTWLSQTVKSRNVTTYTNWLDAGHVPVKLKPNRYTDFEICIEMLIKADTKEQCELMMSSILADFDSGQIELDDMQFTYDFDFSSEEKELVKRWLYSYKIHLTAYSKKGSEKNIIFSGTEKTFDSESTAQSPAVLSLSSDIALNELKIEGLTDDAITIKDIARNAEILIDGENFTITENGTNILSKTDLWEFPKIKPGLNSIKLSSSCTVTIKYRPYYR